MPDANLKRPTKTYLGIQALRAVAAILVIVHHALELWDERFRADSQNPLGWTNGAAGVDIFFVISGFVMASSAPGLANEAHKVRIFLQRRIVRIVPLYWIFTTLKLLLLQVSPRVTQFSAGGWWHVLSSYLFIPSLNARGKPFPLIVQGWTLNFEMLFYLIFALALACNIPLIPFLVPTLLAIAGIGFLSNATWPAFTTLASPIILEFLFGVLLWRLVSRGRLPGIRASCVYLIFGFVVLLAVPEPYPDWRWLIWGLPAATIVYASIGAEDLIAPHLPRWLLEAGNASYATYLVHAFVLPNVGMLVERLGASGWLALVETITLSLPLSLGAGELVHRFVEKPLLTLFRSKQVPLPISSIS